MTKSEIAELYPQFCEWEKKKYGYFAIHGIYLIDLWYEFLRDRDGKA